jgi:hypothetical protein
MRGSNEGGLPASSHSADVAASSSLSDGYRFHEGHDSAGTFESGSPACVRLAGLVPAESSATANRRPCFDDGIRSSPNWGRCGWPGHRSSSVHARRLHPCRLRIAQIGRRPRVLAMGHRGHRTGGFASCRRLRRLRMVPWVIERQKSQRLQSRWAVWLSLASLPQSFGSRAGHRTSSRLETANRSGTALLRAWSPCPARYQFDHERCSWPPHSSPSST